jgi:phage minor structural protein
MDYPIVYDNFETDFSGTGLAVLGNATNIKIKEVINGEFLLSFVLPRTDVSWQYVQPENFVKVFDCSQNKDQLFRIRAFDEIRDSTGKLTSNIQCEHVYYDAHDCKFFPIVELIGQTPAQVLTYAFSGTRFTIGTVEITTKTDIFLDKAYPSEIVAKLIENVGGELIKDNWTISLVNKRGSNTGVEFRYGKNQASLKRETDAKNVITRLYPFGKDGLQIEGSLGYIDSPLINNYDRPRIGYIDYKDIEDPADLLAEALKEWSTTERDGIDKPKVTYSGEFVELKKLQEYGDVEAFGLGDAIKIIDEGLNINTTQRIMEYEYYPYEPKRSTVVLSNLNPRVYRNSRPSNVIADTISQGQYVSDMQTSRGDINSGWLDNIREKLQTEINGMVQTALMHAQSDMYVDNIDNPTKALILGPGLFAIANSKKPNGDWDWRTIANGDRVVADEVDAEWVYAGTVTTDQLIAGVAKISTALIEDLVVGNNVIMGPNAAISWSQVTGNKPTQYTDAQALSAWKNSGYATYINSSGVYSGSFNGGMFNINPTGSRYLESGLTVGGYWGGSWKGQALKLQFYESGGGGTPVTAFSSSGDVPLWFDVQTRFNSLVDFSGATVTGLNYASVNHSHGNDYVKSYTGQNLSLVATETGIVVRVNGVTLGSIFYD